MAEPFLGEIRAFAANKVPRGWASCDGQMMSIQLHNALFAVLGNRFGGDGKTQFALPNLQGRAPMGFGNGPGLTPRELGSMDGQATVPLNASHFPPHTHAVNVNAAENADTASAANGVFAKGGVPALARFVPVNTYRPAPASAVVPLAAGAISEYGSEGPIAHDNMQPYLPVLLCIALQGVFPQRV